jgi:anti-sigma factor RsiW
MNCTQVRSLLQDYAARELNPEQQRPVDEHLLTCPECRDELALLTVIVANLNRQPVSEPRPGFSSRVMAALPPNQAKVFNPWWSMLALPVLAGAAYFFRAALTGGFRAALHWLGLDRSLPNVPQVPNLGSFSPQQLAIVPLAAIGFGLALVVATAILGWRLYSEG